MLTLISERVTWMHRLPAGAKLAALALAAVFLFSLSGLGQMAFVAAGVAALYLSGGIAFAREGLAALRPLWIFLVVLALWHGVSGTWAEGALIALRLIAAVAAANLLTLTTRFDDMMDVVIGLAAPLRRFGLRPETFALAAALVLRFTPVIAQKGAQLQMAWRARSPRAPRWQVIVPWLILAMDDAEQVALALKARGGLAPAVSRDVSRERN